MLASVTAARMFFIILEKYRTGVAVRRSSQHLPVGAQQSEGTRGSGIFHI